MYNLGFIYFGKYLIMDDKVENLKIARKSLYCSEPQIVDTHFKLSCTYNWQLDIFLEF